MLFKLGNKHKHLILFNWRQFNATFLCDVYQANLYGQKKITLNSRRGMKKIGNNISQLCQDINQKIDKTGLTARKTPL